jgi:phosphatidylglycerophosphate synthase
MIDSKCKGKLESFFNLAGRVFVYLGIKADTITIAAFITGILSGFFIGCGKFFPGLLLLWLSGFLDIIDGTVARLTKSSTRVGAYMDLISDRMVESSFILGFAWLFPENYFACLLFLVSVIFNFTTFVLAGALFENKGNKGLHYDAGLAERTETFIVFTLMAFLPFFSYYILMMFNFIIFITGIIRFMKIIKNLSEK